MPSVQKGYDVDRRLSVVMAHRRYLNRGGEDLVFESEAALLQAHGCKVTRITDQVTRPSGLAAMARLAAGAVWSRTWHHRMREILRDGVDVLHVHNFHPNLSPAIYYAAAVASVPVVQTLHNYRLLCPSAIFFRDGRACEDCLGRSVPWPGVAHGCYRQSRAATATVAAMLVAHRLLRTWDRLVDVYVALTDFARQKFIQGGLPAEKIVVKPNFVHPDPGPGQGAGGYALFVGRLAPEKGVATLLAAWERLNGRVPLKIVGDGPEAPRVTAAAQRLPGLEWLGRRSTDDVYTLMGEATALVFPSEWYETFGRVAAEAFARGTPVIAADLGAMAELVEHGRTGLRFRPGDPDDLAAKVEWAWTHPSELAAMRPAARAEFEAKYTAERNYELLMEIYQLAIQRRHERG